MIDQTLSDRALLVIDMVDSIEENAKKLIPLIQGEMQYFRERHRPVLYTSIGQSKILQELSPRPSEAVFNRPSHSAFFQTPLESILRELHVRKITLVGLYTHTSILLTVADALARNYEVIVPETCVYAPYQHDHQYALHLIKNHWAKPL